MKTFDIMLPSISHAKEFVDAASRNSFEIDILSGRYVIDAKSIMGLFSLDLTKPLRVEAHTDDEAAYKIFYDSVSDLVVEKAE